MTGATQGPDASGSPQAPGSPDAPGSPEAPESPQAPGSPQASAARERRLARRRSTAIAVVLAVLLCLVAAALAVSTLTGSGTARPAGGVTSQPAGPTTGSAPPAATTPPATSAPIPPAETVSFTSPSGNIGCAVTATSARCDVGDRDWQAPAKPATCTLDWGQGVQLGPEGSGYVCAGDTLVGGGPALAYGDVAELGTVRCTSTEAGVSCQDTASGSGFDVARATVALR